MPYRKPRNIFSFSLIMNDNLYLRPQTASGCTGTYSETKQTKTNKIKKCPLPQIQLPRAVLEPTQQVQRCLPCLLQSATDQLAQVCRPVSPTWVSSTKDKDNQRRKYDFTCCACTLYNSVDKCQQHGCRMS